MRCRSVPNAGAALRSDRRRLRRGAWRRFWPWKDDARLKKFKRLATDGSAPARTTPIAGSDALLIAYYNTLYQTHMGSPAMPQQQRAKIRMRSKPPAIVGDDRWFSAPPPIRRNLDAPFEPARGLRVPPPGRPIRYPHGTQACPPPPPCRFRSPQLYWLLRQGCRSPPLRRGGPMKRMAPRHV